jgi:hypothetical protein
MINFLIAAFVVALLLIGGAVYDHVARSERQASCERAGGVYVLALAGFTCATAQREAPR